MPSSISLMDKHVQDCFASLKPKTILDVGMGEGKIGRLAKATLGATCSVTGLEGFAPYEAQFKAKWQAHYHAWHVLTFDRFIARNSTARFDLIVFSDVLEHMRWADAVSALYDAAYHSKHFLGVWPELLVQGESHSNPLEQHRSRFSEPDLLRWPVEKHLSDATPKGYRKWLYLWKGYLR